jgi:hypothetical protein
LAELDFTPLVSRFGAEGARYAFESLIAQLVRLEHDDARRVQVRQGDGGLDVICGSISDALHVWQAKFFHPRFDRHHERSVASSLAAAMTTAAETGAVLQTWTLCIPCDLDLKGHKWWSEFVAHHAEIDIRLWARADLEAKLLGPDGRDVRFAYFEMDDPEGGMRIAPPKTVESVDPIAFGITPAAGFAEPPAYVGREADDVLVSELQRRSFVLLSGDSAAGKTRTMFEALRRACPGHEIAAPEPGELHALTARLARLRNPLRSRGLLLWLDDIDEYLGPAGLTQGVIERLLKDDVKVAGTIRRQRFDDVDEASRRSSAVLDMANVIRLDRKATERERKEFARRHPGRRLVNEGIGEHFVAAKNLITRYLAASDEVAALVALLIDWRRITGSSAMRSRAAQRAYAALRGTTEAFADAVSDAVTEQRLGDALVLQTQHGLTVQDYLLDYDDRDQDTTGRRRDVPRRAWEALLSVALPNEAAALGRTALSRGQDEVAIAALDRACQSANPAVRAWAEYTRGLIWADSDPDAATEAWLRALREGDPTGVARSAWALIDQANVRGEGLDGDTEDAVRSAVFDADGSGAQSELQRLLAALAENRGDLDTLQELFMHADEDAAAIIGLRYGRALRAAGNVSSSAGVLDAVLDGPAPEVVRAEALVLRAGFALRTDESDATEMLLEAIDLGAAEGSSGSIHDVVAEFERSDNRHRVVQKLADAGDSRAQFELSDD